MRILFGTLLIGCLILPFAGTYLWLEWEIFAVKKIVLQKLEEKSEHKELVTLSFGPEDLNELRWEHEWEFEYQGQMYDVVERKIDNDTTILICFWDQEETHLKNELRKLLVNHSNDQPWKKERQQRLQTFYKSLFAEPYAEEKDVFSFSRSHKLNIPYLIFPSDPERSPPSPPPDLGC